MNRWANCRIGITGAGGTLGRALSKKFREKDSYVIGFTHRDIKSLSNEKHGPHKWIQWECGNELLIKNELEQLDILILNHGINPKGRQTKKDIDSAIEINALSSWRLIKIFEEIATNKEESSGNIELWVNTSEAEIQPALSPTYELSKRLIGQLVSFRQLKMNEQLAGKLVIRKLVLGPFKSNLNPIGIMNAESVASNILKMAEKNINLIIISPNPITYIIMPLVEFYRRIYFNLTKKLS